MFDELPARSGMNSSAISNVLNYQRKLPKLITRAHLHALLEDTSKVEKVTKSMLANGQVFRLRLTGRGNDTRALDEILVSREHLLKSLEDHDIPLNTRQVLLCALVSPRLDLTQLTKSQVANLTKQGFLVGTGLSGSAVRANHNIATLTRSVSVSDSIISTAPSGSSEAGGQAVFETLGGTSGMSRRLHLPGASIDLMLSVPGIAAYTQILTASRTHVLSLLHKHGGTHKQMPLSMLREQYDGNVEDNTLGSVSMMKRMRNEFAGILPARTNKWKTLYGLRFDWVLEECLGAGVVEIWDTGAVGHGVRALR